MEILVLKGWDLNLIHLTKFKIYLKFTHFNGDISLL